MHNPSYITKNRFGIYYFQYSYTDTENISSDAVIKRKLIRKSLRTRNKNDALHHAKHLWVLMTKIYKKYFTNPELYATAMKLVAQYHFAEEKGWDVVDDFLSELDDDDCELLRLGEKQRDEDLLNSKKQIRKNSESKLKPEKTNKKIGKSNGAV